jgi:hypothetical protein
MDLPNKAGKVGTLMFPACIVDSLWIEGSSKSVQNKAYLRLCLCFAINETETPSF